MSKVKFTELAADPDAPVATKRVLYAKSGGLYQRNSAGTVSALSTSGEVATAVSDHAAASDPHGDRAFATSAAAARKMLTDYANVVVVDAGGNGDYTTLAAALAAITDASATNRYAIMLFGRHVITNFTWSQSYIDVFGFGAIIGAATAQTITFTNTGLSTLNNITFEANVTLSVSTNAVVNLRNCALAGSLSVAGAGASVNVFGCTLARAIVGNATAVVQIFDSTLSVATANAVTGTLRLVGCLVTTSGTGYINASASTSVIELYNTKIIASGSNAYGVNLAANATLITRGGMIDAKTGGGNAALNIATPVTVNCIGTYFKGDTGLAVQADAAFSNAPFFHCVFEGGVTNVTCLAGTANGSSLSF